MLRVGRPSADSVQGHKRKLQPNVSVRFVEEMSHRTSTRRLSVRGYRAFLEVEEGDCAFGLFVPDIPGCVAVATTENEVKDLCCSALKAHVEWLLEDGDPIDEVSAVDEEEEASTSPGEAPGTNGPGTRSAQVSLQMRFPAAVVLLTTLHWAATERAGGDGTEITLAKSKGRGQQGEAGSGRANPKANADVDGDKLVCKKYKNGNAKLALCELEMDDYMSENDRVAKVGLYLKNIGDVGVCNIALWVDGLNTDAMVDFWPNWIDITPNEGYLAPNDGFELGANIFMPTGYPQYYLDAGFRECPSPDAVTEPATHQYCHTIGGGAQGDGVLLEFCEDKLFDSWMKDDGSRIIHSQGRVTNNGTVNVCHLRFGGDRLAQAIRVWPKWFPVMTTKNSPAPLRVGDVMEVGADVPSNGFKRPSLSLLSYQACALEVPQGDDANANAPSPTSPAHDTARLHDDQDGSSTSAKPTDTALRGSASTTQRQQEIDGASFP